MRLRNELPAKKKINLKKQCVEVPNTRREGQTGIYRNAPYADALVGLDSTAPNTLYQLMEEAVNECPDNPFLGTRQRNDKGKLGDYVWQTYAQVNTQIRQVASGLKYLAKEISLGKDRQWSLGIFSVNRAEWNISDMAATFQSLVTVALFDTYGQDALEYVIEHAEIPVIVASQTQIHRLLLAAPRLSHLKVIISMDPISSRAEPGTSDHLLRTWAASSNIRLMDFDELKDLGTKNPSEPTPPSPEDIYTICYTSGTTGNPKGAICTHLNYAVAVRSVALSLGIGRDELTVNISYLPAAHCFERATFYMTIHLRGQVGYYAGSIVGLMDDVKVLKPTIMASVPRLLNRIYDRISQQMFHSEGLGSSLFRVALKSKMNTYRSGGGTSHAVWDAFLFSKVRAEFGGRLARLITGSAPIDPKVLDFLRVVLSCDIMNGYGATETSAALCIGLPGDHKAGPVGPPVPSIEFKLVDVAEMGYTSQDKPYPRGEICARGANIFKGYFKSEELTREALDEEGWYHTGDVAKLDDRNLPVIIDRKKNLFKLSQGEYVAPEKVEGAYSAHPLVMSMFVYGDSLKPYLVGICVPDPESFPAWARTKTTAPDGLSEQKGFDALCKDPNVIRAFLEELSIQAQNVKLSGFEKVNAVHLEPIPFSVDNGLVTPTFKLKRHELTQHYKSTINALYQETPKSARSSKL
ncbi:medium-chain fatty acid-CoA ligase faa2 [Entomophthora muscae]|uniref:Medium-chain fatty acid-CoA ligase faa2 n=2 Tax=Entomophthora muscae TaxID=34485 RepID=A0ACC2UPW2_9FUNG|nr:medium-chain fatty acid-CoA ligase faa2 [Entomophthora muscae]